MKGTNAMRTVLKDRHEVAHYWANKVQSEGRAGNVFFRDSMIFSYGEHFCIARHLPNDAIAFTTRDYSPSTSVHKTLVRHAIAEGTRIIYVPYPEEGYHRNRGAVQRGVETLKEHAATARKKRPAHLAKMKSIVEDYNEFCDAIGQPEGKIEVPLFTDKELADIAASVRAELKKEHEKRKEAERQAALTMAEKIAEWRAGSLNYFVSYGLATMLRLQGDEVQTSRGARIPVEAAKRLWPLILRTMKGERDYEVGMPVGVYQLTKIRRDGSIVVGCHDIAFDEIQEIAYQLALEERPTVAIAA